jgi:hypothetical protein
MAYCAFLSCAADSNSYGYYLTACQSATLLGCGAEDTVNDSFVMSGGYTNTLIGCWTYNQKHYMIHVTGGEHGCSIIGCNENTPASTADYAIVTDTGTSSTLLNNSNTKPNSLVSATTTTLGDESLELAIGGPLYANAIAHLYGGVDLGGTTVTSAAAGTANALPAAPAGYLEIEVNGATQKLPYYD